MSKTKARPDKEDFYLALAQLERQIRLIKRAYVEVFRIDTRDLKIGPIRPIGKTCKSE